MRLVYSDDVLTYVLCVARPKNAKILNCEELTYVIKSQADDLWQQSEFHMRNINWLRTISASLREIVVKLGSSQKCVGHIIDGLNIRNFAQDGFFVCWQ